MGEDPVRVLQRGSRIYAISGNNPVALADPTGKCAMCLNNASNSPGSDSNDFASGGTKTQRDLIEAAFQNACSRIDNVWKDRIPGHEVEPRALDQYKKCLKEKCKTPPRFVVGGIFCDWFDIQGYTFSRPYNPFNVCKIHMCPDYLVSASDGVTPSYIIDETVMHEMSHCCDCQNEDWALEIGSWFYMEEEPQSQVP
ncbi:MAG: hypothetical protein IPI28_05580 [Candidatus Omnitrophica bacterium]|nr:hypothetical protein [Candidatus Omnitrophota bacterium]